jgi:3-oxoacyl-[acyl-carrier protein] reductase
MRQSLQGTPMTLLKDLSGQVAIVTGGSRGLGRYCAEQLAAAGATVVIIGKNPDSVAKATSELVAKDLDVVGFAADVSGYEQLAAVKSELGVLADAQILICSAAVMAEKISRTLRTTKTEWDRVLETNLNGVFHAVSLFVPSMVDAGYGRVINLSACLSRFTGPGLGGGLAPYRISKTAVTALTRNLAAELQFGAKNVLVDAVCPGHIQTDMGGAAAPRTIAQGADTVLWLATREQSDQTGLLWEDRVVVDF